MTPHLNTKYYIDSIERISFYKINHINDFLYHTKLHHTDDGWMKVSVQVEAHPSQDTSQSIRMTDKGLYEHASGSAYVE